MIKRPIIFLLFSWLLGMLCEHCLSSLVALVLLMLSLLVAYLCVQFQVFETRLTKEDKVLLACPIFFILGFVWMFTAKEEYPIEKVLGESMAGELEGKIVAVDQTENSYRYTLQSCIFHESNQEWECGKLLVYLNSEEMYGVGQRLLCQGELTRFEKAGNLGQFDEASFYQYKGYQYKFFAKEGACIGGKVHLVWKLTEKMKNQMLSSYRSILEEEDYGLICAMLLGETDLMKEELTQLYRKSGIAHLLAISGLHITLLGIGFYKLLRKLKLHQWICIVASVLFLLFYGMVTGFSVSTNRAIVMLVLSLCAVIVGKTYDIICAMVMAAFIILIQNPMQIFTTGFLLSFSAILGIVFLGHAIKEAFHLTNPVLLALTTSVSAQIATLPFVLYFFYEFPLYGIGINLALFPLCSLLVGLAFLSGLAGCIFQPAGTFLAGGVHYILKWIQFLCQCSRKLPGCTQVMGKPSIIRIIIYIVGILLMLLFWYYLLYIRERMLKEAGRIGLEEADLQLQLEEWKRKELSHKADQEGCGTFLEFHVVDKSKREMRFTKLRGIKLPKQIGMQKFLIGQAMEKTIYCVLFVAMLLLSVLFLPKRVKGLEITMLDVGQGDGIYLESSSGWNCLIDGGSSSVKQLAKYRLIPFLSAHGEDSLDYVFLSHPDADHTNGILELLEMEYSIGCIFLPTVMVKDEAYLKLEETIQAAGIPIRYMGRGDVIQSHDLTITCLHPYPTFCTVDANAYSMVLNLEYGKFQMLLTGDVEKEGEEDLCKYLKQVKQDYDVLKVAHHGSNYSTSREFLQLTQPEYAMISVGKKNQYGHPGKETLTRLKEEEISYDTTMEQGAITILTNGSSMKVIPFRK